MDKDTWRSFLRFVDEASERELCERLNKARQYLPLLKTPEIRSDAYRAIRFLEQELLARLGRPAPRARSR